MRHNKERVETVFNSQLERVDDCWHSMCVTADGDIYLDFFITPTGMFSVQFHVYVGQFMNGLPKYYCHRISVESKAFTMSIMGRNFDFRISDFSVLVTTDQDLESINPEKKFLYTEDYSSCVPIV